MSNRRRRGVGPITSYHFALNTLDNATAVVYETLQRLASDAQPEEHNGTIPANSVIYVELYDIEKATGLNKNQIRKSIDKLTTRKFHVEDPDVGVKEFNMLNWLARSTFHIDEGAQSWLLSFPMTIEAQERADRDESWTQGSVVADPEDSSLHLP